MTGETRGIYEIFELILITSLLLIIGTAIIYTNQPDFKKASLLLNEISGISQIMLDNTIVNLNYKNDKILVKSDENKLSLKYGKKTIVTKKIINNKLKVTTKNEVITLQT